MKCPNFYDEKNSACEWCNFRSECKADCENYAAEHQEDYPQIKLNV